MDQKKPVAKSTPPGASADVPPLSGESSQTRSRRRFGDGETIVMPLADILRSRDAQPFDSEVKAEDAAGSLGDRTQTRGKTEIGLSPIVPSRPAVDIGGNATVVAKITPTKPPAKAQGATPGSGNHGADESTRIAPVSQRPEAKAPLPLAQPAPAAGAQQAPLPPPGTASATTAPLPVGGGAQKQVVAFFGSKGGTGATVLATNTAHAYAREELKTCVVDIDLQMGDALAAFALQSSFVMSDVIQTIARGEKIPDGRLPTHAGGVSVVSQVGSVEDLDRINAESLPRLIDALRLVHHTVVVDGLRDFSDNALAILDAVDKVCLVVVQEVLAVRRARWIFSILRKLGFEPDDIVLVVNRFDPASDIPLDSLKRMFEGASLVEIANDARFALQALNRGVPLQTLAPQQPITQGVFRLSRFLLGEKLPAKTAPSPAKAQSFWTKLLGGRK